MKFVVTSRPYQDENHPYTDLVASKTVRHLPGEDSKVQSDVRSIIRFRAEELAKKYRLTRKTVGVLVEAISSQNLQTRSFLAIRMAFDLLDSHELMHEGTEEDIIRVVLADIPQNLGDQFDKILDRSPDKEHARRLFCVIHPSRSKETDDIRAQGFVCYNIMAFIYYQLYYGPIPISSSILASIYISDFLYNQKP
jgi:hypothetical protein